MTVFNKSYLMLLGSLISVGESAITITSVTGSTGYAETGMEGYRSTNVVKSYDVDGDNVYGTAGGFFLGNATGYSGNANFDSTFNNYTSYGASWASFTPGADATQYSHPTTAWNYSDIDNPLATAGADVEDWAIQSGFVRNSSTTGVAGTWEELLTFTVSSSTPETFRLGIMSSTLDSGAFSPGALRFEEAGGAVSTITGLAQTARLTGMVFFDVDLNGESSGTFSISAERPSDARGAAIAGVTFDTIEPIPEPSGILLLSMGGLTILLRRSR